MRWLLEIRRTLRSPAFWDGFQDGFTAWIWCWRPELRPSLRRQEKRRQALPTQLEREIDAAIASVFNKMRSDIETAMRPVEAPADPADRFHPRHWC